MKFWQWIYCDACNKKWTSCKLSILVVINLYCTVKSSKLENYFLCKLAYCIEAFQRKKFELYFCFCWFIKLAFHSTYWYLTKWISVKWEISYLHINISINRSTEWIWEDNNLISSLSSTGSFKPIYKIEKAGRFWLSLFKYHAVRDFVQRHVGRISCRKCHN